MKVIFALGFDLLCVGALLFSSCTKKTAKQEVSEVEISRPTIRLITSVEGIDDKSFNAAAWRGILKFYGDTWEEQKNRGELYDLITGQTQDMYIPILKQVADEGYDLICVAGFTFADALGEVAPLYPEQKFMIVDVAWVSQPNVVEFVFAEEQGSYLVGAAAALQAQEEGIPSPKFGFIGGVPGTVITKFEMGYIQGLRSVLPEATIIDYYANSWSNPELAKTQAKNWYDSGIYAIFSAAGSTGNGAIAQAKEYRAQGKNVWAIGVDSDQHADGIYTEGKSAVLTSMIKRVEAATMYALESVANDSFRAGVTSLDMQADGVDYATTNPELKASVVQRVNAIKQEIVSGKIKVLRTYKEALAAGLAPENLGAKDD